MRTGISVMAFAVAVAASAAADDSSAALSAGAIVFTRNTPVRMAAEDLAIGPAAVKIRFEFLNPTGKDVDTVVAFPLPDIDTAEFYGRAIGSITDDPKNFVGFKASVDGKPIAFTIEQRAFFKGKDVTAAVAAAGAPVNPAADEGYVKLTKLAPAKQKALVALGIAGGAGEEFVPMWTVRTRFWWAQKFPAKKTVVIEHSYQPVTGQYFFSPDYMKETKEDVHFCLDAATLAGLRARTAKSKEANPDGSSYMIAYETDYILKTAGNWQGPIGRFHLTLDKVKPENVLSLCWDGALKKTGPTTFEFAKDNFAPSRDIHLLVLEPAAPIE